MDTKKFMGGSKTIKPVSKKIYCGDKKVPSGRKAGTPNECYRLGIKSGFVGGIQKGTGQQIKRSIIAKEVRSKAPRDFKSMTRDQVSEFARKAKVRNYRKLSKDELVESVATRKELANYRR